MYTSKHKVGDLLMSLDGYLGFIKKVHGRSERYTIEFMGIEDAYTLQSMSSKLVDKLKEELEIWQKESTR